MKIRKRFMAKVSPEPNSGCWLWAATTNGEGYGRFLIGSSRFQAHRIAYWLHYGVWPVSDICVLHKCDNRLCVNPHHLFLGTRKLNNQDRTEKGRGAMGDSSGRAVLGTRDVVAVRLLLRGGKGSKYIAGAYGVSAGAIQAIKEGRSWRHLHE